MSQSRPASLLRRFFLYQKERFPLFAHVPLIIAFSFSAIGFSRACRGLGHFIGWKDFAACAFTNITLFFILRVCDEHKDKADDAAFRPYLPVPRGLIALKELSAIAAVLFVLATLLQLLCYRPLLPLYLVMMGYLFLMRYEFFIPRWLKRHQAWYIVSHMAIIPLADVYASSYDWKLSASAPPLGLLFFLGVSYLNGVVLEVGRKLRVPSTEEPGVVSYTMLWGQRSAPAAWLLILSANFLLACAAAVHAGYGRAAFAVLGVLFVLSALPALLLIRRPSKAATKSVELVSLVWALGMYLTLGGIPLLLQLFSA